MFLSVLLDIFSLAWPAAAEILSCSMTHLYQTLQTQEHNTSLRFDQQLKLYLDSSQGALCAFLLASSSCLVGGVLNPRPLVEHTHLSKNPYQYTSGKTVTIPCVLPWPVPSLRPQHLLPASRRPWRDLVPAKGVLWWRPRELPHSPCAPPCRSASHCVC